MIYYSYYTLYTTICNDHYNPFILGNNQFLLLFLSVDVKINLAQCQRQCQCEFDSYNSANSGMLVGY